MKIQYLADKVRHLFHMGRRGSPPPGLGGRHWCL